MRKLAGTVAASLAILMAAAGCQLPPTPPIEAASAASAGGRDDAPPPIAVAAINADYAPHVDRSSFVVGYRRLTESQYRHAIADVFGPDIKISGRFEPERREDGLQAVGNARMSITTAGLEQYISVGRSVAAQVIESPQRSVLFGCEPASASDIDAACMKKFVKGRGRQLFRRPLTDAEIDRYMAIWKEASGATGNFYKGAELSLASMLVAPEFLFRIERAEADVGAAGGYRLDAYGKAARISYLLWDSAPDEALLQAAASGDLFTAAGVDREVGRLLGSPRFEQGVRAFFADMLQFDAFETLSKDGKTYPKFSQAVADSAREETMKFLVDQLVAKQGDYRDIFTSQTTFINRTLAALYNVPFASEDAWSPYTFEASAERSGILTQATFLSLFSHPAASSPTIRGVKMHEIFMCLPTPQPPPDVDFSKVQALESGTVRTRLIAHMTNPGCSSCHSLSDPPGLTLEHFDGAGQHRLLENGQLIDVSAEITGRKFSGAQGLGQYMHDSPLVTQCVVRNAHRYGQGRPLDPVDAPYLARQEQAFAAGGYRLPDLLRNLLSDPQFYRVTPPKGLTLASRAGDPQHDQSSTGDGR